MHGLTRDGRHAALRKAIEHIDRYIPGNLWLYSLAVQYGLAREDDDLIDRFLSRCRSRNSAVPARHIALVAGMRLEQGRIGEARGVIALRSGAAESAQAEAELDLIAASTESASDAEWALHVNRAFARFGLAPIELGDDAGIKFVRLRPEAPPEKSRADSKVTVIVSCFNAEDYIETSMRSLLQQTYTNIEIIAVDDASTDATLERLQALAALDSRIRILRNQKNVGTYVSRNRALRASTGQLVTTQDADDWGHPDRIARQVHALSATPNALACHCASVRMWPDGRFQVYRPGSVVWQVCYPSLMYRKSEMLALTGYWDCVRIEADSEYMRRVIRMLGKRAVVALPEPMMFQLRREQSLTMQASTRNLGGGAPVGPDRAAYRNASSAFMQHATASSAHYDFANWHRPFPVPEAIQVPDEDVRAAVAWED
jgi:hypothetical protein